MCPVPASSTRQRKVTLSMMYLLHIRFPLSISYQISGVLILDLDVIYGYSFLLFGTLLDGKSIKNASQNAIMPNDYSGPELYLPCSDTKSS